MKGRAIWALCVMLGGAMLLYAYLPFETVQAALNRLAPDGRLESFTPELYARSVPWLVWAGWLSLGCAAGMLSARRCTLRWVERGVRKLELTSQQWQADAAALWRAMIGAARRERAHLLILGGIVLAATITAARFLDRPMLYDEAYTYNIFASRPLLRIISDYHLPNNHIFHSILAHFSTLLFGPSPWAVRLPAFLGGILCIPAAYLTARILFDADTALLAAGLQGFAPILTHYATNARGYSLLNLFFLILLGMAALVRGRPNRFAWSVAMGAAILGFYTLPTMLFPFGAVVLWLVGGWLLGETMPPRREAWLWRVFGFVVISIGAGVVLYLPVALGGGFDALLQNPFLAAIDPQDYWIIMQQRLAQTWDVFTAGVSPALVRGLAGAFVVGVVYDATRRGSRPSFPLVIVLFSAAVVLLRRLAPFDRMWLFLVPVFLIWAAAGVAWLWRMLEASAGRKLPTFGGVKLLFLLVITLWLARGVPGALTRFSAHAAYAEDVALFLGEHLDPGDQVVVTFPYDAPVIYYARLYGLDEGETFSPLSGRAGRLYLLLNERAGQTVVQVLTQRKIPPEAVAMSTLTLVGVVPPLHVYRLDRVHP